MGPTGGASDDRAWQPRAKLAFLLRLVALLVPLAAAVVVIRLIGPFLARPDGRIGLLVWIAQAALIGGLVSRGVDAVTRRLLPLAALLNLSLVFPDRAPSRFGVALRAGTIRRLRERASELDEAGLGDDPNEAARRAIELVLALGRHDRLTRGHTERVRAYADLIGAELGLDARDRNLLSWGVILHDVGKVTVPPEILNKPGRPTDEEWQILARHPSAGARMLAPLMPWLGEWGRAAGDHHERWDGTGYPNRLAGTEISLAGRIAGVADAFDVITSKRSYKAAMTNVAARRELVRCAGTQFDPAIVRAFLNVSLGRRRAAGGGAWLGDAQLWGTASSMSTGAVAATTAASVGVALGAGAAAGATRPVDREPPVVDIGVDIRAEGRTPGPAADDAGVEPAARGGGPSDGATPSTAPPTPFDGGSTPSSSTTTTTPISIPTTTTPPRTDTPSPDPPTGPSATVPVPAPTVPTLPTTVPTTVAPPSTTTVVAGGVVDELTGVVEPVVDEVVDPVVDLVVADVVEPVVDELVEPVVADVVQPVVDELVDEVVDPLVDETDEIVDSLGGLLGGRGGLLG